MVQLLIDLLTPPLIVTPPDAKQRQSLVTSVRTQIALFVASVYKTCRGSIRTQYYKGWKTAMSVRCLLAKVKLCR